MNSAMVTRLARGQVEYGNRFDASDLLDKFRPYYRGARVRVRSASGYERTGIISTTTGWKPSFILVHQSTDHGSSDLLNENDEVVAIQRGRAYISC